MLRWSFWAVLVILLAVVGYLPLSLFWRETRVVQSATPFGGRFVKTKDGALFAQTLGYPEQPAVVFIPGAPGWSETWKPIMRALTREGYRTITFDLAPFGISTSSLDYSRQAQALRIADSVDHLRLKSLVLVAQGDGVPAALAASKLIGPRVKGLVIISAELGWPEVKGGVKKPPSDFLAKALKNPFTRKMLASWATQGWVMTSTLKSMVYKPARINSALEGIYHTPLAYKGTNKKMAAWLMEHFFSKDDLLAKDMAIYRSFHMPTLLIWGNRDVQSPPWQGQMLQELMPESQLTLLPDVGHLPQLENEKAVGDALFRFVSNLEKPVKI